MTASNLLDWQGTRASLSSALAGASTLFQSVGTVLLDALDHAGAALDRAHVSNAAYSTGWRAPIIAALTDVDTLAVVIDGFEPNTALSDPTLSVASLREAVQKRVTAASTTEHPLSRVVQRAMNLVPSAAPAKGQKALEALEALTARAIAEATAFVAGVL